MSRLCDCSTRMASFATQPLAVIDAAARLGDLRPSRVQHGDRKVLSDLAVRNLALLGQDGGPQQPFPISGQGFPAFVGCAATACAVRASVMRAPSRMLTRP